MLSGGRDHRVTQVDAAREPTERRQHMGEKLTGTEVPRWEEILNSARRCCKASKLGYPGVDVVMN